MAGMYFLLLLWAVWIYTTFWMDKKLGERWVIAVFSLLLLILYPYTISIYFVEVSIPALLLLFTAYYLAAKLPLLKKLYLLISVLALMMGYAGFQLLEMYDPILLFFNRQLMVSACFILIAYWVYPLVFSLRMLLVGLGSIQGDIIFAVLLNRWEMPYMIGSKEYLDSWAITVIFLVICELSVKLSVMFSGINRNQVANKS